VDVKKVETTPDGWAVTDLKEFHFLVDHPTPRPYGYWNQIRVDARSWPEVSLWVAVMGLLTAGVIMGQWLFLLPALLLAGFYRGGCRVTVWQIRKCPVAIGVVDALKPHPLLRRSSTAVARLTDGRQVKVIVETKLVRTIIDSGGQAEVLFLDHPIAPPARVIGARAVRLR